MDDTFAPFHPLMIVLENILRHGMQVRRRRALVGRPRDIWGPIEVYTNTYAPSTLATVRAIPTARSPLGKGRAWLRLTLMEKSLPEHFAALKDNSALVRDWWVVE